MGVVHSIEVNNQGVGLCKPCIYQPWYKDKVWYNEHAGEDELVK
jgi:hypothetical protein